MKTLGPGSSSSQLLLRSGLHQVREEAGTRQAGPDPAHRQKPEHPLVQTQLSRKEDQGTAVWTQSSKSLALFCLPQYGFILRVAWFLALK